MLDAKLLRAVSESVESQLGLHFPPERWADLDRGLRGAAPELGFESVEKCASALVRARLTRPQVDSLATHLTIGETYFFRDAPTFELLPMLVEQRRSRGKRLRIWSAGCCTGEEPYSIAIALRRAIPDLDEWQIAILATDINPGFLNKAAAGVYGPWSFRGVPEDVRNAWFQRTEDGRFEVLPVIRKMVTFDYLNLVEDVYPSLANITNAMDIIFCRNVLMYFSPAQLRKVVTSFHGALVEGGELIVSATEAAQDLFGEFKPGGIPGIALYRKITSPPSPLLLIEKPPVPLPMRLPEPPQRAVKKKTQRLSIRRDHAADARRLANEGKLGEALAACDRALKEDRLVAAHHYLRGIILLEQNASGAAVEALQRALFLDHDFVLAHFTLGHLRLRQGRKADATRAFSNARSLLRTCAPETVLPESDGITAGRLLAILTSTEEALA